MLALVARPHSLGAERVFVPVTDGRLALAAQDDGWLMYRRTYDSQAHVPFDQIATGNVRRLRLAFSYPLERGRGEGASPVVNGRYLFVTTASDRVIALDAVTGRVLWQRADRRETGASGSKTCCAPVNRGISFFKENAYVVTRTGDMIARNATTGKNIFTSTLRAFRGGHEPVAAPLSIDGGKILSGVPSEGEPAFVAALDTDDASRLWTVPLAPKIAKRGGSTDMTGSYDPDTTTVYWNAGDPVDGVIAIDADKGDVKWHRVFGRAPAVRGDTSGAADILADIPYEHATAKALVHADGDGNVYALDRRSGARLWSRPFAAHGRCGMRVSPASYDEDDTTVFVPANDACGSGGALRAIDLATRGRTRWTFALRTARFGGAVSTAGGLVFAGSSDRRLRAFDERDGRVLWTQTLAYAGSGAPISYRIGYRQFIAIETADDRGGRLDVFALPEAANEPADAAPSKEPIRRTHR